MSGVTTTQARDFYRAAASFYRRVPWWRVGGGETIRVESDPPEAGPWYAVVLGKRGGVKGLILVEDWSSRVLLGRGPYEAIEGQVRAVAVRFGGHSPLHRNDLEVAWRRGYEVAGPDAYPTVFRTGPGQETGTPDAGELGLLGACLWAIPDLLERARDRNPGVFEYASQGSTGRLRLCLVLVPRGRWRLASPGAPS
jgi:hypothetical protein